LIDWRPCHGLGDQSLASYRGGQGSHLGWSLWDLWWAGWHCGRFISEFFWFPLSLSFNHSSPYSYITGGWTVDPLEAAVHTHSFTPLTWKQHDRLRWNLTTKNRNVLLKRVYSILNFQTCTLVSAGNKFCSFALGGVYTSLLVLLILYFSNCFKWSADKMS
jgi:hypothetical protein